VEQDKGCEVLMGIDKITSDYDKKNIKEDLGKKDEEELKKQIDEITSDYDKKNIKEDLGKKDVIFTKNVLKFYDKINCEKYYDNESEVYEAMIKEKSYQKNPNKFIEIFDRLWDDFYFGSDFLRRDENEN
jgi:hypothetical protein